MKYHSEGVAGEHTKDRPPSTAIPVRKTNGSQHVGPWMAGDGPPYPRAVDVPGQGNAGTATPFLKDDMPPTINSEGDDCNIPIAGDMARDIVPCDDSCGAFEDPETLEEYKATLEHYRDHGLMGGNAHGC